MATHSSILAWRISWTEDPGWLWSIGSQRVWHDWSDLDHTHTMWIVIYSLAETLMDLNMVCCLDPERDETLSRTCHLFKTQNILGMKQQHKPANMAEPFAMLIPIKVLQHSLSYFFIFMVDRKHEIKYYITRENT